MSDYPPGMTLRPIDQWPHEQTRSRRRSPFSATWGTTIAQLDLELRHLGAGGRRAPSVLQIAMREQDFRRDGLPRANAVPAHPGVILSIESKHGPLSYPCDTFTRWADNLRAIALALEGLRRIDRYGVTQTGQQYRGWQAIEATPAAPLYTAEQAERLLRDVAAEQGDGLDLDTLPQIYRRARTATHPDRNNGDQTGWDRVEAAAAALRAAGRLP